MQIAQDKKSPRSISPVSVSSSSKGSFSNRMVPPALQLAVLLSAAECRLPAAEQPSPITPPVPTAMLEAKQEPFLTRERWYELDFHLYQATPVVEILA